jgi:hypothetical protein
MKAKITWFDMLVYRLFVWRWNKHLTDDPTLRELFISWMKAFNVLNEGDQVKVTITKINCTKE